MSKDKDEWGNIELPGFGDDLLLSPSLNTHLSNKLKGKDPEYQKKIRKTVAEQWQTKDQSARIAKMAKSVKKKWQDPEFVQRQKIGRAERYATPERCGNFKSAIIGTNKITGKTIRLVGTQQMKDEGFDPNNIYSCLCGNRKSHKGYVWSREEK